MMKVNDFYRKVVESLGLNVSTDDYVVLKHNDEFNEIMIKGKVLTLPTQQHITTMMKVLDSGDVKLSKVLYNPLNEDVVKGDSESLKYTKDVVERRLAHGIVCAGRLLLMLAANPKLQSKVSMDISNFLIATADAKNQNTGNSIVDNNTVEMWDKLYKKSVTDEIDYVSIYLKKLGIMDTVKFNRLGTLKIALYDALNNVATNDNKVFGIKPRPRDVRVFKILLDYLIPDISSEGTISIGSNDGESPGFIALMKLYLRIITPVNKILLELKDIDASTFDSGFISVSIKETELDTLGKYKNELLTLPSETDVNRNKTNVVSKTQSAVVSDVKQTPQETQMQQVPQIEEDPARALANKVLYGGGQNNLLPIYDTKQLQPQMPQYMHQQMIPHQQQTMNRPVGLSQLAAGVPVNPGQQQYMNQQYMQPQYVQPTMMQPQYMQPQYQQPVMNPVYANQQQPQIVRPIGLNQPQFVRKY